MEAIVVQLGISKRLKQLCILKVRTLIFPISENSNVEKEDKISQTIM